MTFGHNDTSMLSRFNSSAKFDFSVKNFYFNGDELILRGIINSNHKEFYILSKKCISLDFKWDFTKTIMTSRLIAMLLCFIRNSSEYSFSFQRFQAELPNQTVPVQLYNI